MIEQRPLRLGDIVDDYCPRERRLTNHAIVAIVEQTIKQTRCTTCDHEHVYKEAREPRKRKKDATSALYSQVLAGLQKPAGSDEMGHEIEDDAPGDAQMGDDAGIESEPAPALAAVAHTNGNGHHADVEEAAAEDDVQPGNTSDDTEIWPMHRRLIRAQLPRTGNEPPPARPLPEFTVRQPGARGQRQWGRGGGQGQQNGNHGHGRNRGGQGHGGNRSGRGPSGFDGRGQGGGRPGGGRGRRSR